MKEINQTQALILGSLHSGAKTGSEIVEIADAIQGLWSSSRSRIYREMYRLEDAACVKASPEPPPANCKEMYELTDMGREVYENWVDENDFTDGIRNPWFLRLALTEHDGRSVDIICRAAHAYHRARWLECKKEKGTTAEVLTEYHANMSDWFANHDA